MTDYEFEMFVLRTCTSEIFIWNCGVY